MSKYVVCPGRVIVLSGPSGAGKTTLHDLLLKSPEFRWKVVRSISATTRQPRGAERNGREYLFLSKKMFEYKIRAGHFLEWAKVFENYYGTPLKNVRDILRRGQSVLLCIDVQGGGQVEKKVPDAVMIFVKTPDLAELRRRLEKRSTEDRESVELRLRTARKELAQARQYDHVIVNDQLPKAFGELVGIVRGVLGSRKRARVR